MTLNRTVDYPWGPHSAQAKEAQKLQMQEPEVPLPPQELEAALREGDTHALSVLFEQHKERLRRAVQYRMDRQLRGRLDPDDVIQEAFLAAAKRLVHFASKPDLRPYPWIRTITLQSLVELTRHHLGAKKRNADRQVSLNQPGSQTASQASPLATQLVATMTSPTRAAVRSELALNMERVLDGLSEMDRDILGLRHFEALTNNEAAEVLGIHKAACTNRYLRALERLRAALSEVPEFGEAY